MHVYRLDITVSSVDCTIYTPGIGTYSFTVFSPLWRIQHLLILLQPCSHLYNVAFSFHQVSITAAR